MSLWDLGRWIWDPMADDDSALIMCCFFISVIICLFGWDRQIYDLTATVLFGLSFLYVIPFVVIVSSLCEPSDLSSDGCCALCFSHVIWIFLNPWILDQTAVMNCFMIKSGPLDSSDGPDLICLSQTHDSLFWTGSTHPGPSFPTRFSCLSPIFSTVLWNTPLFFIITPFFLKKFISLCFLSFKNIFALY